MKAYINIIWIILLASCQSTVHIAKVEFSSESIPILNESKLRNQVKTTTLSEIKKQSWLALDDENTQEKSVLTFHFSQDIFACYVTGILKFSNDRPSAQAKMIISHCDHQKFLASYHKSLEEIFSLLHQQSAIKDASNSKLLKVLDNCSYHVCYFALDNLHVQKNGEEIKQLIDYIKSSPDKRLQLRAIGVLVETGNPQASEVLISLTKKQSADFVIQLIYALGETGGETAKAFLYTIMMGHPDQTVRDAAKESYQQLKSRF